MTRLVASRIREALSGKMPTTSVRRPISRLSRYLSLDSLAPLLEERSEHDDEEVPALTPA
jgi:hypothetical protein